MSWLSLVIAYWKANLLASLEYRAAFVSQLLSMFINNSAWLAFWGLFFARFPAVRGWQLSDMIALWATAASGVGLMEIACGGVFQLPRLVEQGELDIYLVRPGRPIMHLLLSRSSPFAWGDLAWGALVFLLLYPGALVRLWIFVAAVLCVAVILVGFMLTVGSLAFWTGRSQTLQEQAWGVLTQFATWPPSIYRFETRLLLYLVVPALLIGAVPATALRSAEPSHVLVGLVGAAVAFGGLGWSAFHVGLRRYESGNRIGLLW